MSEEIERLRRRLERERRTRLDAESIAEQATSSLYDMVQRLEASRGELAEASRLVTLLQRVAVAANEAAELKDVAPVAMAEFCQYIGWTVGHMYIAEDSCRLVPSGIWYLAEPDLYPQFRQITAARVLAAGQGLPGRVFASGRPVWVEDIGADDNLARQRSASDLGLKAACGFPIVVGSEVVAVLEFFSPRSSAQLDSLMEVMVGLGSQLGRVEERSRAARAMQASEERNRLVIETANAAFVAIDRSGLITEWNRRAESLFGWSREEVIGLPLAATIVPPRHRRGHVAGLVRYAETGVGTVLGRRVELDACRRDGQELPIELMAWVVGEGDETRFNAFIHDITERQAEHKQLEHHSFHDTLTGLPNRSLLLERLGRALSESEKLDHGMLAVLFIDLDRFKPVNDSLGHEAGDKVLIEVARRLNAIAGPSDTVARLGGDEFVVVRPQVRHPHEAIELAETIISTVVVPFSAGGNEVHISASVGIVESDGRDTRAEQLLSDADLAMYRAKERGRGVFELFDQAMRTRLQDRISRERQLRSGIESGQLVLHYQPVVDLGTGLVSGVEALVRWNHPEAGLQAPGSFITLAEETGLIGSLGQMVRGEACRQLRDWRDRLESRPPVWVTINLSVREVEQPRFISRLLDLLAANGLPPEAIVMEVTESVVMHDAKRVIRRLWELREAGVRMAIDDFGTGYSSLDRLRRMPVDMLKIDRSFVSELGESTTGAPLAGAIVAMAHSLGLEVVAEGVETEEQLSLLRQLGCESAQGYYIARPGPAADIETLLRDGYSLPPVNSSADSLFGGIKDGLAMIVSQALTDRAKIERTTRSLLAELQRLVEAEAASSEAAWSTAGLA